MTSKNFPFKEVRKEQEEFFKCWDEYPDKKYVVAQLPTGSGKSGLAITKALDEGTAYLVTCSKLLQDQYENDFIRSDLVSLKGKDNYLCGLVPGFSCANGPCASSDMTARAIKNECSRSGRCPYKLRVDAANNAKIFLTNGSMMSTTLHCKVSPLKDKRDILIFDEAHLLESFLVDAAKIELCPEMLNRKFKIYKYMKPEDVKWLQKTKFDNFNMTANNKKAISLIHAAIHEHWKEVNPQDDTVPTASQWQKNAFINEFKKYRKDGQSTLNTELNSMHDKFKTFEEHSSEQWVVQYVQESHTLILSPLKVDWVFKKVIEPLANKFMFMSATILDFKVFCDTFGLPYDNVLPIDVESSFDPKKSPIVKVGTCRTSYNDLQDTRNMDKIVSEVKKILDMYPNQKGIIHTGNMKISNYIKQHLADKRLLVREGDTTNNIILEKHQKGSNTVLVSSSMLEGVDLRDDLSRFQIIVKLPWLSLADPRTKILSDKQPGWYKCELWRRLIQACGRSTRNDADTSDTYVLDSSFDFNLKQAAFMLPKYFKKRVR